MRADNHEPTLMAYCEADKNCWAGQSAQWFLGTQKNATRPWDAELALVEYRFRSEGGSVHIGFQAIYETLRLGLKKLLSQLNDNPLSLIIVGHSLGAALATLCALDSEVANLSNGPTAFSIVTGSGPLSPGKSFSLARPRLRPARSRGSMVGLGAASVG
jgi:pimeloyl-ACP methyl ester carboxylesterase